MDESKENPRGKKIREILAKLKGKDSWEGYGPDGSIDDGKTHQTTGSGFLKHLKEKMAEGEIRGQRIGKDYNILWGIAESTVRDICPIIKANIGFGYLAQQVITQRSNLVAETCPEHAHLGEPKYNNIIEAVFGVDENGNRTHEHVHGQQAVVEVVTFFATALLKHTDLLRRSNWGVSIFFRFRFYEHVLVCVLKPVDNDGNEEAGRVELYTPDEFPTEMYGKHVDDMAIY